MLQTFANTLQNERKRRLFREEPAPDVCNSRSVRCVLELDVELDDLVYDRPLSDDGGALSLG